MLLQSQRGGDARELPEPEREREPPDAPDPRLQLRSCYDHYVDDMIRAFAGIVRKHCVCNYGAVMPTMWITAYSVHLAGQKTLFNAPTNICNYATVITTMWMTACEVHLAGIFRRHIVLLLQFSPLNNVLNLDIKCIGKSNSGSLYIFPYIFSENFKFSKRPN